jgi:hypothetical protein
MLCLKKRKQALSACHQKKSLLRAGCELKEKVREQRKERLAPKNLGF